MDGSILHINITLHLLHEEDKRDTDKGEENIFSTDISKYAYWRDFFCILLAKFSGRCQQDYAIFVYNVCCFRNFLQLIKPGSSLWTGSLVKGRFPSVTSLWTLPAVVRPFQLEPVHRLAREKQLLFLQISTLRRKKCLYNHTRKEDSSFTFFILVHVKLTLGIIMTQK